MGFLDKVKSNLQETATMAREGIDDLQTKRELGRHYEELGRRAYELIESGKLQTDELDYDIQRIRDLRAEVGAETAPPSGEARA
ncbi:MAG TPA: hypothetical protein VFA66_03940 [Gaiellaceae bacterium]|nr:hypothetical protein [Gaiellaceae bacterium]